MSLLVFIREYAKLQGTKSMCHEGDCGVCIVSVTFKNKTIAVNSCLVPVLICDKWDIYTIEGIGNKCDGYHTFQAVLAKKNGSLCGYCSSGMVMNMYSLGIGTSNLSMEQIENSFAGNLCRCTGYRAILDAFKGFATDAPPSLVKDVHDIEESYQIKPCRKFGIPCTQSCYNKLSDGKTMLSIKLEDASFYKVSTIETLFTLLNNNPQATYILNGGNTAHGVYPLSKKDMYIDINDIPDFHQISKTDFGIAIGGGLTLTTALQTFQKYSNDTGFKYLNQLAEHIEMIANIPVRNIGTIAGNLMIKYEHNEFPSDLFVILETVEAEVHILQTPSKKLRLKLWEFLKMDMHHKIISNIFLLSHRDNYYVCRFYKVMPRAQNARAHVNAGFFFKIDIDGKVYDYPNIIFGGINKDFIHARKTEQMLLNKSVFDKKVLESSLQTLHNELLLDNVPPDFSQKFHSVLAEGLLYKFLLSIKPQNVDAFYRSGGTLLKRGLSSGTQEYDTNINLWPVNKPMPKLEALAQTSGEVQYCSDLGPYPGEVFCAFVVAEISKGQIDKIDADQVLQMKGVVAFFSAKDIAGMNLCISAASKLTFLPENEILFAEKDVLYAGQPVGVIVAETHKLANEAAKLVEITYKGPPKKEPIITIDDAINANDKTRMRQNAYVPAKKKVIDEPPLCLSCVIPIAIRKALNSARRDSGNKDLWYQLSKF
ncbi:Aldehyde oxidase 2 [Cyphomyrmex costatus]|uniref:Aldehyde oxidase 2 n=1 Tax=Cyphomyrmex costatus TaxID=456900 RepID=A0A151IM30_9HYME|nr:Aldehyde oxidase 2 [Cyphomyrmex costatus]